MGSLPPLVSTSWPLPRRTRYSSETTRPPSTRMSPPPDEIGHAPESAEPVRGEGSGGLRSAGPGEKKDRGGRSQRGAQSERSRRRDVVPHLAREHRGGEQAGAGNQVVDAQGAPAPPCSDRRGD